MDLGPTRTALMSVVRFAVAILKNSTFEGFDALLETATELTGAERGFIVEPSHETGELEVTHRHLFDARGVPDSQIVFSRTLVRRAMESKKRFETGDAPVMYKDSWSVKGSLIRSMAVAPLMHGDDVRGALVIDSPERNRFTEERLDVFDLLAALGSLMLQERLEKEEMRRELDRERRRKTSPFPDLNGESTAWQAMEALLGRVAPSQETVLIQGESGTGKELIANAIHKASRRAAGPFVAVNMGALPDNMIEVTLFGHEKGAFTGADRERLGKFRAAEGGTLFLDEIGEMPVEQQVKLLRAIQERKVTPVGADLEVPVDVRFVAATNKNLEKLVKEGRFREDLYYRLMVISVTVPPLRERDGDVPVLAMHILNAIADEGVDFHPKTLSKEALEELEAYPWPGNVRELRNTLRKAVLLAPGKVIEAEHIDLPRPKPKVVPEDERAVLLKALEAEHWNVSAAARRLNISRTFLHKLMRRYKLERP